jgi:hypothetical protein
MPIRISDVGTGSLIDMSSTGVAFLIEQALQMGASIHFEITVQESHAAFELRCEGTIVRVEQRGAATFAAARIEGLSMGRHSGH